MGASCAATVVAAAGLASGIMRAAWSAPAKKMAESSSRHAKSSSGAPPSLRCSSLPAADAAPPCASLATSHTRTCDGKGEEREKEKEDVINLTG
jgi:hypothetical protein